MSSKRIIINTSATYLRSVIAVALALFSSRWILNGLGKSDFGIFNLVGSVIVFIVFLNVVMASSVSRYFSYEIGRGSSVELNKWFNTALSMHLIAPVILISIGYPIGHYCIKYVFTIPPDRVSAALWVFRISLISALINMVSVSFVAMFTAKQKIAELAVINIFFSISTFIFAYTIMYFKGDRLIYYSIGYVLLNSLFLIIQIFRAIYIFPECKIDFKYWFDTRRFKEISSFAIWILIGGMGALFRNNGSSILLNIYFGANINAAYGLSSQVSTQTSSLSQSMLSAMSPEITASEGRGDRNRVIALSLTASKFATIMFMVFAIPFIADMDYILLLWLKDPPEYTSVFCRMMIVMFLIENITIGNVMAVSARGKIAAYQATLGTILVSTLPIAWIFLALGCNPSYVGLAGIITMIACSSGRVLWAKKLVDIPIYRWVNDVLFKCIIVGFSSAFVCGILLLLMPIGIFRLVTIMSLSTIIIAILSWFVAFNNEEKHYTINIFNKIIKRK